MMSPDSSLPLMDILGDRASVPAGTDWLGSPPFRLPRRVGNLNDADQVF
jgi:hypothetical protein